MSERFGAVVLLWGGFLAVLTAVAVIAFEVDPSTPALLGGGAAVVLLAGFGLALLAPGGGDRAFAAPDTSLATVWLAISLALLALSAALGFWLTLIGAGMVGIGLGGIVRELHAQRRALAAERDRG